MHSISYGMNDSEEIIRVAGPSVIVKAAITHHDDGVTFIYSYQQTTYPCYLWVDGGAARRYHVLLGNQFFPLKEVKSTAWAFPHQVTDWH